MYILLYHPSIAALERVEIVISYSTSSRIEMLHHDYSVALDHHQHALALDQNTCRIPVSLETSSSFIRSKKIATIMAKDTIYYDDY
jgi:hypothetical protein